MGGMDPVTLMPAEILAERTPLGRRRFSRWVRTGAGGTPYEPRGWYPSTRGNRLAPGYDGIGTATPFVGLEARLRGFAQDETPPETPPPDRASAGSGVPLLFLLGGAAAGIALAYITYDETAGTGARLRRRPR